MKLDLYGKRNKIPNKTKYRLGEGRKPKRYTMHIPSDSLFEFKLEMVIQQNALFQTTDLFSRNDKYILNSLEKISIASTIGGSVGKEKEEAT